MDERAIRELLEQLGGIPIKGIPGLPIPGVHMPVTEPGAGVIGIGSPGTILPPRGTSVLLPPTTENGCSTNGGGKEGSGGSGTKQK